MALVPARAVDIPPELSRIWTIVPWQASQAAAVQTPAQSVADTVQDLLTLLSPAVRLEPGLLRAVRGVLPAGRFDPGLEARVWQDAVIVSQHSVAATMDPEQRKEYQRHFAEQSEDQRGKVLELIRKQRGQLHPAVWFEEIIGLDPESQQQFANDIEDAVRFLTGFVDAMQKPEQLSDKTAAYAWISRVTDRLPDAALRDPRVEKAVHDLYEFVRPQTAESLVPDWFDPAMTSSGNQTARQAELWQVADQLLVRTVETTLSTDPQPPERGSPLGLLHTASGEVRVAVGEPEQEKTDFWQDGQPPTWAVKYGWDAVGPWATFRMEGVEQRLRWIPAGSFVMGSPEDEEGRYDDEGPQHEVELTQGFWLFDRPCTQGCGKQ